LESGTDILLLVALVHKLKWTEKLAVGVGIGLFRLWSVFIRIKPTQNFRTLWAQKKPGTIVLLWHNRLALGLMTVARLPQTPNLAGLVSASHDGAFLAEILKAWGASAIRGSSSHRAVEATREMLKALAAGSVVLITPDGPLGPIYTIKEGIRPLLARTSVTVLGFNASRKWELKSWDHFQLPKPFSTISADAESFPAGTSLETIANALKRLNGIPTDNA
jgi:Kdo2-lipid IVA 3' secondary acyltransferase